MSRPSEVIVLAEDALHQRFVRRFLERAGVRSHAVRYEALPSGRGCGEQWVREHYATAVAAYRRRAHRAATVLIVVLDADRGSVESRLRQLETALESFAMDTRAGTEKIVHLVPRRTIETWVLYLTGHDAVDEKSDLSRDPRVEFNIKPAAHTFFEWSRPGAILPESCLPALRLGIQEIRRLG